MNMPYFNKKGTLSKTLQLSGNLLWVPELQMIIILSESL
jgi:hypothetical protein